MWGPSGFGRRNRHRRKRIRQRRVEELRYHANLLVTVQDSIQVAINAIESASIPHSFLGIDQEGHTAVVTTAGNPNTHLVLRGGDKQPNFEVPEVTYAACKLEAAGLEPSLMVDCSHANASKIARNQVKVWKNILKQRAKGKSPVTGAMVESFLEEGTQKISEDLQYGLSITDPCIDWETTERMLNG